MGVAVAPDGVVYVTDHDASVVQYFAADSAFLGLFGGQGSADGQLFNPRGVAVGSDGTIYVADSNGHRVQAFCVAPG